MSESATIATVGQGRADKRALTARRIVACAQELALEYGLDGFTMDDLAHRAGVARRTLFNYFPGKDDAVLGGPPEIDESVLETFARGGPTGRLIDDLAAVVHAVLRDSPDTRVDVVRARAVLQANPRLIAAAHDRLRACVDSCLGYLQTREGVAFDRARIDVAIAVVLACVNLAMDRYLDDADADLDRVFAETLTTARQLLV